MRRIVVRVWMLAATLLVLASGLLARASNPDFLVVGMQGEVASYNSLTSETHVLLDQNMEARPWRRGGWTRAVVAGVDEDSTMTIWVLTGGYDSGYVHPFEHDPDYHDPSRGKTWNEHLPSFAFSCIYYDRRWRTVAGIAQPLDGTLEGLPERAFKAVLHDGSFVTPNASACETARTNEEPPEFGYFTDQQMRAWFPTHAAEMPTTTTAGWLIPGQSRKMTTYWGGVGGVYATTPTLFLFLDRTTSLSTYAVRNLDTRAYTFDDAVAMPALAEVYYTTVTWRSDGTSETQRIDKGQYATGQIGFFLRGNGLVECTLDPNLRVLYADSHNAYLCKNADDAPFLAETKRTKDFYRLPLSAQGCGQTEHLPDLPFPPFRMFRIPWEDMPTSGTHGGP